VHPLRAKPSSRWVKYAGQAPLGTKLVPSLGAPTDIDQLHRQITVLEQRNVKLTHQIEERDLELDAARAANREMIHALNKGAR
jgi:hypothetical protein